MESEITIVNTSIQRQWVFRSIRFLTERTLVFRYFGFEPK